RRMLADIKIHENARMPAEALLQKGTRDFSGGGRQQLRLHAMDAGRLLQGFDDVREQSFFALAAVRTATSVADRVADRLANEQIADDALILLIDKEGVAEDAAPLDGGIAREDFGVHVPEDHLRRGGVVPGKRAAPQGDLVFQQRSKVGGREMSEIENFHTKEGLRC